MHIEIVYGDAHHQTLLSCEVDENAVVKDAILKSGILLCHPELKGLTLEVGIFSKSVELTTPLKEGDRIEIYRPLIIDPKEARRLRSLQRTHKNKS